LNDEDFESLARISVTLRVGIAKLLRAFFATVALFGCLIRSRSVDHPRPFCEEIMSNPYSPLDCSSSHFEKVAIARFRSLNPRLPSSCVIFREPWDCSTVLCIDLAQCVEQMDQIYDYTPHLTQSMQCLGLGKAIVFRMGSKLMGWRDSSAKF